MGRGCSQVPLISSCQRCALQYLAFLQGKARAEQRWLVTWNHGRSGKGRLGDVLPSKRGKEDPDAWYRPALDLPPRGDIAQWAGLPREMDESSQPLGWVSPWRNLLAYSGDVPGITIPYVWCEPSVMRLCRYALNLHNTLKRTLSCKQFFWLQPVLSKQLFLFTSGNRPVFSLAVIWWPTKLALCSSNSPAVRSALSPQPDRTITPKSAQLTDMLVCYKLVDTGSEEGRWPCCCAPEAVLLMRHMR